MGNLFFTLRTFMASIDEEATIIKKKEESPKPTGSVFTADVKLNAAARGEM